MNSVYGAIFLSGLAAPGVVATVRVYNLGFADDLVNKKDRRADLLAPAAPNTCIFVNLYVHDRYNIT